MTASSRITARGFGYGAATICLVLIASCGSCGSQAGKPCPEEGRASCDNDRTQIVCEGGRWRAYPCEAGCKKTDTSATCDIHANTPGDACAKRDQGRKGCTKDRAAMLVCTNGKIGLRTCPGPGKCDPNETSGTPKCDGGEPTIGEPCKAESVPFDACNAEGTKLIVCSEGKWREGKKCVGSSGCKGTGMTSMPECDNTRVEANDPCELDDEARTTCLADKKGTSVCRGGKWTEVSPCAANTQCNADAPADQSRVPRKRWTTLVPKVAVCK